MARRSLLAKPGEGAGRRGPGGGHPGAGRPRGRLRQSSGAGEAGDDLRATGGVVADFLDVKKAPGGEKAG